jgi:transposase
MSNTAGSEILGVGMSTAQETALAALRSGSSFPQAAEEAGVNRATVYRWIQRDAAFRAAYNAWQRELTESAHARLLKLSERAVEVLEHAIKQRDNDVAYKLLKHLGVLRPRKAGSTDERVVKLQLDLKEKRELRNAEVRLANHVLKKARIPRRERREALEGRAGPEFMEDLRAAIEAAERREAREAAADATPSANPGDAPQGGAGEDASEAEDKLRPEREMGRSAGANRAGAADATGRATGDGVSHEPAVNGL